MNHAKNCNYIYCLRCFLRYTKNCYLGLCLPGKEAAGGHDVLSARCADGACYAMGIDVVAEAVGGDGGRSLERGVGRRVEGDEIDPAAEPFQQAHQLGGVPYVVVEPLEECIFERDAPLPIPVVTAQQSHHIGDRIGTLGGHYCLAFVGKGVVQADGHVALALFQKPFETGDDAHRRDGDAPGTPRQAPVGGEHIDAGQYVVQIVHGFTHAHVYYVGELFKLVYGKYLVEDCGAVEIAMEPLLSGYTETATHFASHLAGDAQGASFPIGNIHCLYVMFFVLLRAGECRKEVFFGPVLRYLTVHGCGLFDDGYFLQSAASLKGKIGHRIDVVHPFGIEPVAHLPGGETGQPLFSTKMLKLRQCHSKEIHAFHERLKVVVGFFFHHFLLEFGAIELDIEWYIGTVEIATGEFEGLVGVDVTHIVSEYGQGLSGTLAEGHVAEMDATHLAASPDGCGQFGRDADKPAVGIVLGGTCFASNGVAEFIEVVLVVEPHTGGFRTR